MKIRVRAAVLSMALLSTTACSHLDTQKTGPGAGTRAHPTASGNERITARRAAFEGAMQAAGIPGAQLIYRQHGEDEGETYLHGVLNGRRGERVTEQTTFQAASLSKVVAAYITLRFADAGKIDLDAPLWKYWHSPRTQDNALARGITARMVLNHTTGLPNWQISPSNPAIDGTPLESNFAPGTRFAYSGEGFYLLQRTLEHIAGSSWNALAEQEVFSRFDMPSSSFLTKVTPDPRNASGHEQDGTPRSERVFAWENTAWTLVTNAHDYGNFIQHALYKGEGLQAATRTMMLSPSSNADNASSPNPADPFIGWGLGIGLQDADGRRLAWHWGDNPGFKAFFALDPASGESLVLLTNSENGPASYKQVLRLFMGDGSYPAVDWIASQE